MIVAILSFVSRLRRYCAVISSCTRFQEALFCPLLVPSSLLLVGRVLPACMVSGWSKRVCAYSRRESSHARHKPSKDSYNDLSIGDRGILYDFPPSSLDSVLPIADAHRDVQQPLRLVACSTVVDDVL